MEAPQLYDLSCSFSQHTYPHNSIKLTKIHLCKNLKQQLTKYKAHLPIGLIASARSIFITTSSYLFFYDSLIYLQNIYVKYVNMINITVIREAFHLLLSRDKPNLPSLYLQIELQISFPPYPWHGRILATLITTPFASLTFYQGYEF